MSFEIGRKQNASMYGPTTGDSIRLADTELFIRIEKDFTTYGDECKFGGGKSLRAGTGLNPVKKRDNDKVVDTIITNAVILDYTGIYKADISIKDGKKKFIGKGGNSDMMDNVDFIVSASTEVIAGEGTIVTAGGIDTHVHYITPEIVVTEHYSGITAEEKIKFLKNHPGLRDVDAIKNNRIYKIGLIDLAPGIRNSKTVGKLYQMFYGNEK